MLDYLFDEFCSQASQCCKKIEEEKCGDRSIQFFCNKRGTLQSYIISAVTISRILG